MYSMYLTSAQHDRLQTLVSGFEIPFRSFIASEICNAFPTEVSFSLEINKRPSFSVCNQYYQTINSELGKIKANPGKYYSLLRNTVDAKAKQIVVNEIDVPNVATIIVLSVVFRELFSGFLLKYNDDNTYLCQAFKFKYVRNKLDHRGCKTLETLDLSVTLDFISNALLELRNDNSLFWEKSLDTITKELTSLQTSIVNIPVEIHNIPSMPFPDMKIVCRDKEIEEIKEFVYGKPGALRKRSSLVLFGYGGVGKTALVLEALKQIIQDLQDGTTLNNYHPHFILFFTAKDEMLGFSKTSGKIELIPNRFSFKTSEELIENIYTALGISSFSRDYNLPGLIIIDNLETLSAESRKTLAEFIHYSSPQQIQYIITSRNEEDYEYRKKLAGFEDNEAGLDFIDTYINENNYDLTLNTEEAKTLLQISTGNTLVLVLCLRRLSLNLTTISGIANDLSAPLSVSKLKDEVTHIPKNGFDIICEYMFKDSFQEIQENYRSNSSILSSILKIFAVYPSDTIDMYTISMLSKQPYSVVDPIIELLCRYLIIEKIGETYQLNQFAQKFIIELFAPDSETYAIMSAEITQSTRTIQAELRDLRDDIERNSDLRRIIQDWYVVSDGDKIAAAKAYRIYGDVLRDCNAYRKYHVVSVGKEYSVLSKVEQLNEIEQNTMHPYVKYQKARTLQEIASSQILSNDFTSEIIKSYTETIWAIKVSPLYSSILMTTSYASILWKFGIVLSNSCEEENLSKAIRYFEEAQSKFEQLCDHSENYYKCIVQLGETYIKLFEVSSTKNMSYIRKARGLSSILYRDRDLYTERNTKKYALALRDKLQENWPQ